MKTSVLLILLIFCLAGPGGYPDADKAASSSLSEHSYTKQSGGKSPSSRELSYEVIRGTGNTYGYRIYRHGRLYVDQPHRPVLPGNAGFATKEDAGKVAELVMMKIRKGEAPPTVSREELMRLGVVE